MASDANDNVAEENFNKFRESMYQYLNEPIKDFAAIKPQLLNIFKTHLPIRNVDYQYGLSKSLHKNRSAVREYFKSGNQVWHCCECTRIGASKNDDGIIDLIVVHGIVFVKLEHDCKPRDLSFVQKVQKLYKEKKVEEADTLQKDALGSEDLNVRVKRGTKDSSKPGEGVIAEVRLLYSQMQEKLTHEKQISISDEQADVIQEKLSPEEAFTEISENLKEYTNESKEVVMANKSKLLSILKTHRPVKNADYLYGLLDNLRKDRRIIVFEWGDGKRVREYSKRNHAKNLWDCRQCFLLYRRKLRTLTPSFLYLVNGIAFVQITHDCNCKPRIFELVMQYQKFLENGEIAKARAMAHIGFTFEEIFLTGTINKLGSSLPEKTTSTDKKSINDNEDNSKMVMISKRKMTSDEKSPVHKKSKLNESKLDDIVTDKKDPGLLDKKYPVCLTSKSKKRKQHVDDELDSSMHPTSEPPTSIETSSNYHFEKPSTSKLQETCEILNIEYRNKATKLWDKITFDQIDTVLSAPKETHYFETDNFYQILSLFFTGKSKQHDQMKSTIIDAFREQLVSSGEITTKKFNKKYLDTVTDEHFAFIAKYLSCRILIFDGENGIKKYGKWKSSTNIRLTLVVAFKDGYFSIVLKL